MAYKRSDHRKFPLQACRFAIQKPCRIAWSSRVAGGYMMIAYAKSLLLPKDIHKRNFGLDVLRACAILFVLFSHGRHLVEHQFPALEGLFVFGYLGVEIFFVLSGFLIGGIAINQINELSTSADVKNFWIRRWFRTVPVYLVWLLIQIPPWIFDGGSVSDFLPYFVFAQTLYWPVQPYPFNVSWSLAVEEWFYIIFPLVLLAACIILKDRRRGLVAALVVLLGSGPIDVSVAI
ncbi:MULTISPECIES: acyltransferase family protein [Sphingomonas]|uniref:Acyltransferase n=1 Tax=Sphingomonas molluscorum TaxID=418184 RepID=A0ABU8Q5P5_9SPHN